MQRDERIFDSLRLLFKPHPWHGVAIGPEAPDKVMVYVEIVPSDTVKYEIDKASGYLKIDRPQQYSSICPSLYGFVPQTYCAERVAGLTEQRTGRSGIVGDGDPLDICVLSENTFTHGNFIADSVPIGGFRLLDGNEADDKIVAVLYGDVAFGSWRDIEEVPAAQLRRLEHYFLTYKQPPGSTDPRVEITDVYGRTDALEVIERSRADYRAHFGDLPERLLDVLRPDQPSSAGGPP